MKKKFLEIHNARTHEQRELMKRIVRDGVCPFCIEYLEKYHPKPIIRFTEHWVVTENMVPYPNTKIHLLLISKIHTETPWDLPVGALDETAEIIKWAYKYFCIESGALAMRFGKMRGAGATVQHTHLHVLSQAEDAKDPALFYVGSRADS